MALLTEEDVRRMSGGGTRGPVVVRAGEVLTPAARDWLREKGVEVVYPQGQTEGGERPSARYRTISGAVLAEKPEHMTHLKGNILVPKTHPRIVFRGELDTLEAEILWCQSVAARENRQKLAAALGEVLDFTRNLVRCDVLGEKLSEEFHLCGLDPQSMREWSHYPERHLGQPHFMPDWRDGPALLALNRVRTAVRRTELAAYPAFRDGEGGVARPDLILGLNRLSSLLWILMIQEKAGRYADKPD